MKADDSKRKEPWADDSEKIIVNSKSYEKRKLLGHGKEAIPILYGMGTGTAY